MTSFDPWSHDLLSTRTQTLASVSVHGSVAAFQDGEHVGVRGSADCHNILVDYWRCCAMVHPQRPKQRVRKLVSKPGTDMMGGGGGCSLSQGIMLLVGLVGYGYLV